MESINRLNFISSINNRNIVKPIFTMRCDALVFESPDQFKVVAMERRSDLAVIFVEGQSSLKETVCQRYFVPYHSFL